MKVRIKRLVWVLMAIPVWVACALTGVFLFLVIIPFVWIWTGNVDNWLDYLDWPESISDWWLNG